MRRWGRGQDTITVKRNWRAISPTWKVTIVYMDSVAIKQHRIGLGPNQFERHRFWWCLAILPLGYYMIPLTLGKSIFHRLVWSIYFFSTTSRHTTIQAIHQQRLWPFWASWTVCCQHLPLEHFPELPPKELPTLNKILEWSKECLIRGRDQGRVMWLGQAAFVK